MTVTGCKRRSEDLPNSRAGKHRCISDVSSFQAPQEIWLLILEKLPIATLKQCALVCQAWKDASDHISGRIWKTLVYQKHLQSTALEIFDEVIESGEVTWRDLYHLPLLSLLSLFQEVFTEEGFMIDDVGFVKNSALQYGPWAFFIEGSAVAVSHWDRTDDSFTLEGPDENFCDISDLCRLAVKGPFLFALNVEGYILHWNYETKQLIQIISPSHYDKTNHSLFFIYKNILYTDRPDDHLDSIPYEDIEKRDEVGEQNKCFSRDYFLKYCFKNSFYFENVNKTWYHKLVCYSLSNDRVEGKVVLNQETYLPMTDRGQLLEMDGPIPKVWQILPENFRILKVIEVEHLIMCYSINRDTYTTFFSLFDTLQGKVIFSVDNPYDPGQADIKLKAKLGLILACKEALFTKHFFGQCPSFL